MSRQRNADSAVNPGRHQRTCSVCGHQQQEEIETAFIGWRSPAAIAEDTDWRTGPASIAILTRRACFRSRKYAGNSGDAVGT